MAVPSIVKLEVEADVKVGFFYGDGGAVTKVTEGGIADMAGIKVGQGWRLLEVNCMPVGDKTKSTKIGTLLSNARSAAKPYCLTFVRPVCEPLLGEGIPLGGCLDGVPHMYVQRPTSHSKGTVLLVHGSSSSDWLGNTEGGTPTLGGMTELAFRFRDAGFTAVVLDSYNDGRREWIGGAGGAYKRVDDVLAALEYFQGQSFPQPVHVYGKSNGGWVLVQLLHLAVRQELDSAAKARVIRLMQALGSLIIQCPYLNVYSDVPLLRTLTEHPDVHVPSLLFLLAKEDGMLEMYGQPIDVGAQAAEAIGGTVVEEWMEDVIDNPELKCHCVVQHRGGAEAHRPHVEIRTYSNIGHTFVMDAQHNQITDGSCVGIVDHAIAATISWCSRRKSLKTTTKLVVS